MPPSGPREGSNSSAGDAATTAFTLEGGETPACDGAGEQDPRRSRCLWVAFLGVVLRSFDMLLN